MNALLEFIRYESCDNWSVSQLLANQFDYNKNFELVKIGTFLTRDKTQIILDDDTEYKRVKIKLYNKGVMLRNKAFGRDIGTKKQFIIKQGQFLLSKIDARNGAFGLATKEVDGAIITGDFFSYNFDKSKIDAQFLVLVATTKQFQKFAQSASSGTTGRQRIDEKKFLDVKIPLPSLAIQQNIVKAYQNRVELAKQQRQQVMQKEIEIENYLYQELGIELLSDETQKNKGLLQVVSFESLRTWSILDNINTNLRTSSFDQVKLKKIIKSISTGTTPPTTKIKYFNGNINFYTPSDLGEEKDLYRSSRTVSDLAIQDKKVRVFLKNTILFVGIGSTTGKVGILKNEFAASNQQITGLQINEEIANVDYVYYYLKSFQEEIVKGSITSTIPIMNQGKISDIIIELPPLKTQVNIARHIKNIKVEIKSLKQQAEYNQKSALSEFEAEIFV